VILRLLPILGITVVDILGFSILIPLMPFFVKKFGASDVVVGLLFASFAFCQFIGAPLWGHVSDRIGRKAVLIISQIGATIGWAMLAFAPNVIVVFIARVIEGLSGGNISVTQAYVSDLVEPEHRGRAFAYVGAAFSTGLVGGPLMGGFLSAHYGFAVPFLVAAGLQAITLVLTILVLPESRSAADEHPVHLITAIRQALGDRRIAPILLQKLAFSLGLYGWFSTMMLMFARQFGFNETSGSYLMSVMGITSVVMQLAVVGRITDALGDRRASLLGLAALMVAFGIVPFAHLPMQAAGMIVFFAFGLSLVNATLPALLSHLAPENARGTILGVASSLDSVSGIVMPVISTTVLQLAGVAPTVAISFGFTVLALGLGALELRKQPDSVSISAVGGD
jgi:MFS transporter, DHA1 family, tetracycline resistance protein